MRSESSTLPLKVAETGPILTLATAAKPFSPALSRDWQPGMQLFRTSGSLSNAQTLDRGAGRVASPVIVIAIPVSSHERTTIVRGAARPLQASLIDAPHSRRTNVADV